MKGHTAKHGKTWRYVVDLGPDPATGKRRQRFAGCLSSSPTTSRPVFVSGLRR